MVTICGRDPGSLLMIEVEVFDGRIAALRPSLDTSDLWLAPGLIDLQVNGYDGIDLNDAHCTAQKVVDLVRKLAVMGTTTLLPTLVTASAPSIQHLLATIQEARQSNRQVEYAIPFVHLEGPSISPLDGYRGAHDRTQVRPPSITEIDELQAASSNLIGMVTLSPHWDDAPEFIHALCARNITVSIGHTHASAEQIKAAVDAGACLSTHLGNGIAAQLARHPNPLWTQLAEDRLSASFIADGAHLPADTLRVMLRAKGKTRSLLVSDSVALAGSLPGAYSTGVGGEVVVEADGSIRLRDSGLLAGSGITLKDAVARAVILGGCTLADAVAMATCNPGKFVEGRGVLEVGASADLICFRWAVGDRSLAIADVLVQGESVGSERKKG